MDQRHQTCWLSGQGCGTMNCINRSIHETRCEYGSKYREQVCQKVGSQGEWTEEIPSYL
jgi:hypothetical protein